MPDRQQLVRMSMDYGGNPAPQTLDLLDHGEIMATGGDNPSHLPIGTKWPGPRVGRSDGFPPWCLDSPDYSSSSTIITTVSAPSGVRVPNLPKGKIEGPLNCEWANTMIPEATIT
jgi:hypothetical protein